MLIVQARDYQGFDIWTLQHPLSSQQDAEHQGKLLRLLVISKLRMHLRLLFLKNYGRADLYPFAL